MKIILEGCDGTGKSTLAKLLADKYNLDICHCSQSDPADYDFYKQTVRKDNVVWDRHTLGELIYPYVFYRQPKLGVEGARLVVMYAREAGAKIFVLTSDIPKIKQRLIARGTEDPLILKRLEWIDKEFRHYANIFNIPVIDTSKMTMGEIFELVEREEPPVKFIH